MYHWSCESRLAYVPLCPARTLSCGEGTYFWKFRRNCLCEFSFVETVMRELISPLVPLPAESSCLCTHQFDYLLNHTSIGNPRRNGLAQDPDQFSLETRKTRDTL